jgi:hypothetical protein
MARSPESRKLVEWRRRMVRFEDSPHSVVRFCQEEGVSVPSFYHWRKKLQSPACEEVNDAAASFQPVRWVASPCVVTVRLPGGTQLDVPTADAPALRLTLQMLVEADAQRSAGGESC